LVVKNIGQQLGPDSNWAGTLLNEKSNKRVQIAAKILKCTTISQKKAWCGPRALSRRLIFGLDTPDLK